MKMPKLPEPNIKACHCHSTEQLKQYGRDLLEDAAQIAWKTCSPAGDEFGHGYNKAAVDIERGIRQLKEQIK